MSPRKTTKKSEVAPVEPVETTQAPASVEEQAAEQHVHDHDHDHAGHDHEGHNHDHGHEHGPVLNPDCTRELVLDVPADEVAKTFRQITSEYRKFARIPGFRPGKVPETVIKRRFANEIRKDAIDRLLPERFNKAVIDLGIKPVGQPQVTELTVDEGEPLHVKAVFEFVPEFSVSGYTEVKVEKPSIEVTEEEFQQELEQLRDSRATVETVDSDRKIKKGDWAEIKYKGVIEGEADANPVEGESALLEIGGKDTVEAFSKALTGTKVGQEIKAEVTYPADYVAPNLAGKTVSYEIEVKAIKKRTVPELTDEFAKELGDFENLAALEARISEHLESRKKQSVEHEVKDKLAAALTEKFVFAVPESLVQAKIDERLERGLRALAQQGMGTEQMRKLDFTRLRAAQRDGAVAEVKTDLILDRIASEEAVAVTDEELDREVQIAALQSREPVETLHARLEQEGRLESIRQQMRREKTAHLLYERM